MSLISLDLPILLLYTFLLYFIYKLIFFSFKGPELPFQLASFTMMSNGNNGFLTIGGWSPSRSERLNEIWEMVCDPAEENCNDWTIKAYFDQSRQPPLVSMWIPESVAPSSFGCPGASIKGDIYVPKC